MKFVKRQTDAHKEMERDRQTETDRQRQNPAYPEIVLNYN